MEMVAKPKPKPAFTLPGLAKLGLGNNSISSLLQKNLAKTMKKKNFKDLNALKT